MVKSPVFILRYINPSGTKISIKKEMKFNTKSATEL